MRFSIIIPVFNAEKFIKRSINSVLAQTLSDFELIVINDGSVDGTMEQLSCYTDSRLQIISKQNEGVSVARNVGILQAKGDYICFLDADDEFLPNHLQTLDDLIKKYSDKEFFITKYCITKMQNCDIVLARSETNKTFFYENAVEQLTKNPQIIFTGCLCIKREMFKKYGMFEPGVKLGEDTDMWQRIYVHTGFVFKDTITVKRNRDGSEATKFYQRRFDADPLNRMPSFLSDNTINSTVKESLMIEFELTKLQVARSYLYIGKKKEAKKALQLIDSKKVSLKKMFVTKICFLFPSWLIRWVVSIKNSGMYKN